MKNTIKILAIEPRKQPVVKEIENTLESLQHEVGGDIEAVYPFEDSVALICNDEGKINGMKFNRALRDEDGQIYDVVAGTFLIVGLKDSDFGDLSDEMLKKYSRRFQVPETFINLNGKIIAVPIRTDRAQARESREER